MFGRVEGRVESGRRVLQPKHGLYVIGNKKVLIP